MEDLAIDRVETGILDVPLVRPLGFAPTGVDARPILLVTVTTRGATGVGEGIGEGIVPGGPWWGGESVETVQLIVERPLAPLLTERPVAGIPQAMNDVVNAMQVRFSCWAPAGEGRDRHRFVPESARSAVASRRTPA